MYRFIGGGYYFVFCLSFFFYLFIVFRGFRLFCFGFGVFFLDFVFLVRCMIFVLSFRVLVFGLLGVYGVFEGELKRGVYFLGRGRCLLRFDLVIG